MRRHYDLDWAYLAWCLVLLLSLLTLGVVAIQQAEEVNSLNAKWEKVIQLNAVCGLRDHLDLSNNTFCSILSGIVEGED